MFMRKSIARLDFIASWDIIRTSRVVEPKVLGKVNLVGANVYCAVLVFPPSILVHNVSVKYR